MEAMRAEFDALKVQILGEIKQHIGQYTSGQYTGSKQNRTRRGTVNKEPSWVHDILNTVERRFEEFEKKWGAHGTSSNDGEQGSYELSLGQASLELGSPAPEQSGNPRTSDATRGPPLTKTGNGPICLSIRSAGGRTGSPLEIPARPDTGSSSPDTRSSSPTGSLSPDSTLSDHGLTLDKLGKNLPSTIGDLLKRGIRGPFHIQDLPNVDWANLMKEIRPRGGDFQSVEFERDPETEGICRLGLGDKVFTLPEFNPADRPSPEETEDYFNELAANPPKESRSYYVGPPRTEALKAVFDGWLYPGDNLKSLGPIPGANEYYLLVGEKDSGSAMHCEDFYWRSCLIVWWGWKPLLIVHATDTERFEEFVREHCRRSGCHPRSHVCDQFAAHHHLFMTPKKLRELGIGFDIVCLGPGQMMTTEPRQYHEGLNKTTCIATVINLTLPNEPAITPASLCPECGMYNLKHESLTKLNPRANIANGRRAKPQSTADLRKLRDRIRIESQPKCAGTKRIGAAIEQLPTKRIEMDFPTMLRDHVLSRQAVEDFMTIVKAFKNDKSVRDLLQIPEKPLDRALKTDKLAQTFKEKTLLDKFLDRLMQLSRLSAMEEYNRQFRRKMTSKNLTGHIIRGRGLEVNTENRKKLQNELSKSRTLRNICSGKFEGLLGLLRHDNDDFLKYMTHEDIETFHTYLGEDAASLCSAVLKFQRYILRGDEVPEYVWETKSAKECAELSLEDLISILDSLTVTAEDGHGKGDGAVVLAGGERAEGRRGGRRGGR